MATDREQRLLAQAVLGSGLRSVLLLDAGSEDLAFAAATLRRLSLRLSGRGLRVVYLRSDGAEDDLWLRLRVELTDDGIAPSQEPGPLAATGDATTAPLIVVPDLGRLGVAAARGLVTVVDASVAHLERHGVSRTWTPDAWYLAACARSDIGRVSSHLLDRFVVRLDVRRRLTAREHQQDIRAWIDETDRDDTDYEERPASSEPLPWPSLTGAAVQRVLDLAPMGQGSGHRRDIALGRLAVAGARLRGQPHVTARDVERAAELLGLSPLSSVPEPLPSEQPAGLHVDDVSDRPQLDALETAQPASVEASTGTAETDEVIRRSGDPIAVGTAGLSTDAVAAYPEDAAPSERELAPLREGGVRYRRRAVPRGRAIGVQATTTTADLALLATIVTAARWHPYRRRLRLDGPKTLQIELTDLRAYRRAPDPEHLFILLLDFTALPQWEWSDLLFPHLRWAYVNRAQVCVIRVGGDDAPIETRAQRLLTRNLLDRRLDRALSARKGRATPLAHGLKLALETLRRNVQQGRGSVRQARVVAVTDGRGNVPLAVDPDLKVSSRSGRAGIEDALAVAKAFKSLSSVDAYLVDPAPDAYEDLVTQLAAALGARVVRRSIGTVR